MTRMARVLFFFGGALAAATVALQAMTPAAPADFTAKFAGPKANTDTVSHSVEGMKHLLTLSNDFKVPDTPDPHWMLVDSKGTMYLLDKLMLKGDRVQRTIAVPGYVTDVKKVVIWCAWAEANLGEAAFDSTLKTK